MPKPKGLSEERIKRVTLKIDEDGRTVTAKFATLGVRDLDGDIIEAGAIGEQNVFLGAWNHDQRTLPPGVGTTYESKDAALFRGNFLDTTSGRDHYETLKAADGLDSSLMEWSFRFFVTEGAYELQDEEESFIIRKARVTHVAPVESGAGIDTRTVDIKCVGCGAKASQPEVPTCTHCGAKAGHEQAAADTTSIDYEKLATAVATAVVTAMSQSPKGGCGGGCGGGKGVAQKGDTLGSLIRTLRDEKELTNDDLAEAAGVSVSTIGQILGGTLVCPKASRLEALAQKLDVKLSWLVAAAEADGCGSYEEDDPKQAADPEPEKAANPPGDLPETKSDNPADDPPSDDPPEGSLEHQVQAIMSGFPGLPPDIDPAIAAFENYQQAIAAKE